MIESTYGVPLQLAATERAGVAGTEAAGPVMVFLHGLGCERGQFVRQMEGLEPRLRLISLDLPGHGESLDSRVREYTLASMTAAVCGELHARAHPGVVLVGHSAGGLIALRAAVEHPALVRGVAMLDTNLVLSEADRWANRVRAQESEAEDWRRYFMASMAAAWGECDGGAAHRRTAVFDTLVRTPEHVVRPLWHDVLAFEPKSFLRRSRVPVLYVRSKRETDLVLLRSLNPLISTVDLQGDGTGHWLHLQQADAVNETLHTFLAQLTGDDG
ncbi:alpha/beta fold hydrolase [Streptomyces griseorubiginosus]|uniref:alpha/beta fold hydrolase n=1 Tax=Streptomyces griseorubiginosus TaxID=67304 RepID=UPI0036EF92A8